MWPRPPLGPTPGGDRKGGCLLQSGPVRNPRLRWARAAAQGRLCPAEALRRLCGVSGQGCASAWGQRARGQRLLTSAGVPGQGLQLAGLSRSVVASASVILTCEMDTSPGPGSWHARPRARGPHEQGHQPAPAAAMGSRVSSWSRAGVRAGGQANLSQWAPSVHNLNIHRVGAEEWGQSPQCLGALDGANWEPLTGVVAFCRD